MPDERDRHGSLIWIQLGHVEVINKVDELLVARRAIVDTSLHTPTVLKTLAALVGFEQNIGVPAVGTAASCDDTTGA